MKLKPIKEHTFTSINWSDIKERKHDFLRELINTVSSWVYNKTKAKAIIDERLIMTQGDYPNASTFLATQAFSKFRPGYPQGQFGELLLFNFIQHFFRAVPLLRKQRIMTSVGHERYGADAIHFKKTLNKNHLLLGESKCYESKYKFRDAFETSLDSIVKTFNNIDIELDSYIYDDFIETELIEIAKDYKNGKLSNVHFELICLVAYNENKIIDGKNEDEIKDNIRQIIENRCSKLDHTCFDKIDAKILDRINYIIFPIWELDQLLVTFKTEIGANIAIDSKSY